LEEQEGLDLRVGHLQGGSVRKRKSAGVAYHQDKATSERQLRIWPALCAQVAPWIRTPPTRQPVRSELNMACPSRPSLHGELGGAIARPTKPSWVSQHCSPRTPGIGPRQTRMCVPQ
jgi:hypothetical protein